MIQLLGLGAILFSLFSASTAPIKDKAIANTHLENSGNGFSLTSDSYQADESFVYTSTLEFQSGQAGGLVIGGQDNDHYFVFNIDRIENHTKLLYFWNDNGNIAATEYRSEYYIGNDKVTESELNVIRPKVASCNIYHLKVVVTVEDSHAYAEFYIDNIKRFGVDNTIDLNALADGLSYQGGYVGYNVFNASIDFKETTLGASDYSYYTEAYRNQYHYSQYAHWNNDPNGLVYFNGYYHMYYQTHPYSQYWDHMYWGHARSKDLVHWEELPYALFPDDGNMGVGLGVGYAWSGIAMVYHPGMSDDIDSRNWFPNGNGTGLIGYYTRDGMMQDQVIITSDDEGMTWTKRSLISQYLVFSDYKVDCRDPSIFSLKKNDEGKVTLWGMLLSGGTQNRFWFLKSTNMLDWEYAGGYDYVYPECMSVYSLTDENGVARHAISVSSRHYAVGNLVYNDDTGNVNFILPDGRDYAQVGQSAFKMMDYAEDSYAAQAFYIDDASSDYFGKTIAVSWYSGLPSDAESGIYAKVRHPWNGGGMAMPVELGLVNDGNDILLTQKPITVDNDDFDKTSVISISSEAVSSNNSLLESVNTHIFELAAEIDNPNLEVVEFRVAESEDEYTAFGWNATDGYYFDRTHTSTAGISFAKHYNYKFASHLGDGSHLSFYVLSDNGGIEVFCDEYRYAFYGLTLAAPYSIGASFITSGDITVESLEINEIGSIWKDVSEMEEGVLYLDQSDVSLDLSLYSSKDVIVYSSNHEEISYELVSGEDVIEYSIISKGVRIQALANGNAEILASTESESKSIFVTVDEADVACDYPLTKEGIKSGYWRKSSAGLVGQASGDGYYLSDTLVTDFTYSANFTLDGIAAGLLVRAKADLSDFVMCNLDVHEGIAKVFSPKGELARANVNVDASSSVAYIVSMVGNSLSVSINGTQVLLASLPSNVPESGYLGLNVFNGKATFNDIHLAKSDYGFVNEDLVVENAGRQYIHAIYNQTNKNSLVNPAYYHIQDETLVLSKEYFSLLDEHKVYRFYVVGESSSYSFAVNVETIEDTFLVEDRTLNEGLDVVIYIAQHEINSVSVNGVAVSSEFYTTKNYCLRISSGVFSTGENAVVINGETSFNVTVLPFLASDNEASSRSTSSSSSWTIGAAIGATILVLGISIAGILIYRNKRREQA